MTDSPNEALASLLVELGWSPRTLARRINQVFGVGSVADTSPYHWRDSGCVPRPPLPELVAWVLSRELGRPVTVAELWPGCASYQSAEPGRLQAALERGSVGNPLLDQIEQSIPLLQRLDDAHGGGVHLPYVGAQFRAVALLLHQGGHPARVEQRLFAALAELGQLGGWMALDAGQHGLAQRYLFTALRAAHQAGYHGHRRR